MQSPEGLEDSPFINKSVLQVLKWNTHFSLKFNF
jgi:hypothetical protein